MHFYIVSETEKKQHYQLCRHYTCTRLNNINTSLDGILQHTHTPDRKNYVDIQQSVHASSADNNFHI